MKQWIIILCVVATVASAWQPGSWIGHKRVQLPIYPDQAELEVVKKELRAQSPLVFSGETDRLREHLAKASIGQSFVLIGGDCAESFSDFTVSKIKNDFIMMLQMSMILMYGSGRPVIQIGRMAGQFAKPRSSDMETRGDESLPVYRGDIINRFDFTATDRQPDPTNMLVAYHQSVQTLNLIRAFIQGGYSTLYNIRLWRWSNTHDVFMKQMEDALVFMRSLGIDNNDHRLHLHNFYTGHECLLLDYEECLTRIDSISGDYYDCSAHFIWLGERTRSLDSAQVEFLRGVSNPIGIKVSADVDHDELLQLIHVLNPRNTPGKISIIVRMGANKIDEHLPPLIWFLQDKGVMVLWISDPMHGNGITAGDGIKTRNVHAISSELESFFRIHRTMGTVAGGIHLEMTHKEVTECVDESIQDLTIHYDSKCDPRLNRDQSFDIAYMVSKNLQNERHGIK